MLSRANVKILLPQNTIDHKMQPETMHDFLLHNQTQSLCVLSGTVDLTAFHKEVRFHHILTTGNPQRSALAPLLFSIYTKSLCSVISLLCRWHKTLLLFICIHHSRCSEDNQTAFQTDISSWWSPTIWNSTLIKLKWYNYRQRTLLWLPPTPSVPTWHT